MNGTDIAVAVGLMLLSIIGILAALAIAGTWTVLILVEVAKLGKPNNPTDASLGSYLVAILVMIGLDVGAYWVITHLWYVIKTLAGVIF